MLVIKWLGVVVDGCRGCRHVCISGRGKITTEHVCCLYFQVNIDIISHFATRPKPKEV